MFSFHKPRVYRSAEGCCICRAKSSSSRFTDSRKYEQDSMKCFDLKYPRHGEICNACVLLVKRFKRLPVGSTRHWGHVVDARAGPGTKSLSKHKKSRDEAENTSNNNSNNSASTRRTQCSKSLIPEKFSKIFKKNKKNKRAIGERSCSEKKTDECRRRSSITGSQIWEKQNPLSNVLDSMDSDPEDISESGETFEIKQINPNNSLSVQFQTQTRASSYRASRKRTTSSNLSSNTPSCRKALLKTGSKRRKCMPPMRNRSTLKNVNDNVQFFDESEWQTRKTCCGMMYVCSTLPGTILIDLDDLNACRDHRRSQGIAIEDNRPTKGHHLNVSQKTIIATLPTVVQISTPSVASVCPPPLPTPVPVMNMNPTPVLKKHHLFFKRQSECFPHVDIPVNSSIINSSHKTETLTAITTTPVIIKSSTNLNNNRSTMATLPQSSAISNGNSSPTVVSTSLPLAINTTNISAISNICPSSVAHMNAQMPRQSTAKLTTISPPLPAISNMANSNRLLHKIKTGKIFKHSLDKIGIMSASGTISPTNVDRIKAGDLQELKPVIRSVPKSYVLTKPTTSGSTSAQCTQYIPAAGSSPTSTCSNSSVISSSSSSTAPKFSDNSSDSGFDENLQDRKSASPLQEETERKLAARIPMGNVHTMFLASGVQIHGQHQNLMLTANEVAAKLLQNRKQQITMMASSSCNGAVNHYQQHAATNGVRIGSSASLKISQVSPTPISSITSVASASSTNFGTHIKPTTSSARTIYNNNTIQHENGVTTIVPASSLAASTQTAAMNALAPSSVTITPAPIHHLGNVVSASGTAVSLAKKVSTSGVGVNLMATNNAHLINNSNSVLLQHNLNQNQPQQLHHNTAPNINQKIILLKTTGGPSKYNNLGCIGSNSGSTLNVKTSNSTSIDPQAVNTSICKN